jgi:hypothetical protein
MCYACDAAAAKSLSSTTGALHGVPTVQGLQTSLAVVCAAKRCTFMLQVLGGGLGRHASRPRQR